MIAQALVALILVLVGGLSRNGFQKAVEFTAPVFWLFMLAVGIGLFVLRAREPKVERPFKVPLYPVLPIIFCATSAYLLFASIAYAGWSAFAGIVLLALGVLLSFLITFVPITSAKEELAS